MSALKLFKCWSQLCDSNARPTVYETVRTSNNVPRLSPFLFQRWNNQDSLLLRSPRTGLVRDSWRSPTVQFTRSATPAPCAQDGGAQ